MYLSKIATQLLSQNLPMDSKDSLVKFWYIRTLAFKVAYNGGVPCTDAWILVLFGSVAVGPLINDWLCKRYFYTLAAGMF